MSIEIFRITENGAGWFPFEEATKDEQMNIELGLMTKQFTMLCMVCHIEIEKGNVCVAHKDSKGGIYFE